jgi:hypothetical protein
VSRIPQAPACPGPSAADWIRLLSRIPARWMCLVLLTAGAITAGVTLAVGEAVHLTGSAGVAALVGCVRIGRRRG